jgi:hypothetical protein
MPFINPLIVAEIVTTNFVGALFWVAFLEAKKKRKFSINIKMVPQTLIKTKAIFLQQWKTLKRTISVRNLKIVGSRFKKWFKGELVTEQKELNGEIFATVAMGYLLSENFQKLDGPLGDSFLDAIRLRWSDQLGENATIEEIANLFKEYSTESLSGAISTIKGKMFEIMVTNIENTDNDNWNAKMFSNESHPDSDIIFTNSETGEQLEVSLKATGESGKNIIEHALDKYPDTPIMTTDEVAALYPDNDMVFGSGISNEDLQDVSKENVNKLINSVDSSSPTTVVLGGVTMSTAAAIWPFTIAYFRGKISYDHFERALIKIVGQSGVKLASRLSYALLSGPIFAWYLFSKGC